jgi:hypothetical protein
LCHRIVHAHAELLLEFSKLGSHALADRLASHGFASRRMISRPSLNQMSRGKRGCRQNVK